MIDYKIIEIDDSNIQAIVDMVERNDEEFVRIPKKTIARWADGTNKFDGPGEKLWGVFDGAKCIATGGLSHDPYLDDKTVGRVRGIYVDPEYRKHGLAKILLHLVIDRAKVNFLRLRLGTTNPVAAEIYKSFGFVYVGEMDEKQTYEIKDVRNYEYPANLVK